MSTRARQTATPSTPPPRLDTVVIERVQPMLDGGRYHVKRAAGEDLVVEADIFKEGHDVVSAVLKWRKTGELAWKETRMRPVENDRWRGLMPLLENATYEYTVEAWGDVFASWVHEIGKKYAAGNRALGSEALEGSALVTAAAANPTDDSETLKAYAARLAAAENDADALYALAKDELLSGLMALHADRSLSTEFKPVLKVFADRKSAAFASWYEFFPRSAEGRGDKGSTFRDCLPRIDDAKAMGFDVIYFPPIHPIGETKRKGRNNSLQCEPDDPGVPYAIGNYRQGVNGGGHKDVAPELGTLKDFDWLVGEIRSRGMEIALDFAINCSPDHPYVRDHPEWFFKRPDGSIKYAENPPKKYEDVYPLNFHNENWMALWEEMKSVIEFWIGHGVKIFRVDNPHTKPVAFWEWLISEIRSGHADVVFLSEAFTRPKMMKVLAKAGFNQSYTYFTWRNERWDLTQYLEELTQTEMKEFFRGNFFTNTPDILPFFLQSGGRPAFMIRAVLAATMVPVYGIYSGFELCENAALPGREEYLDSEKYQLKERDWNAPGNIKQLITKLNAIRRENRALQSYANLRFHPCDNERILVYSKATTAGDNVIIVAVTLDPFNAQSGIARVPSASFGWIDPSSYAVEDLLTDERFQWRGDTNYIALDPFSRPAHILRLARRPV